MKFREATDDDVRGIAAHSSARNTCADGSQQAAYRWALEDDDGKVLGVGGFNFIVPGTAWCWMDTGQDWAAMRAQATTDFRWAPAYLELVKFIDYMAGQLGVRRLMASVEVDFPEALRMIEHLGFIREATMSRFFGDRSAFLYAKFYGGA